jgi:hypothetical protein
MALIAAGDVVPSASAIPPAASITGSAALAWVVWYLLAKYLPSREKAAAAAQAAQQAALLKHNATTQEENRKALDQICNRNDEHLAKVASSIVELGNNCHARWAVDEAKRKA